MSLPRTTLSSIFNLQNQRRESSGKLFMFNVTECSDESDSKRLKGCRSSGLSNFISVSPLLFLSDFGLLTVANPPRGTGSLLKHSSTI
ncbi:hypothetical protein LOK49_LG05G00587 [Camellia lanceoleosa]|uniref:Uncharacterized protein n=1 Tax=Camellia lanceoleosa TaxID=1840588 RepID=A0ACC0HLA6_9ERIC|nr:hypothetical protein LOK49_LG05G00587 [Camellia lanceoleosa]